jgi:hypothetical protein
MSRSGPPAVKTISLDSSVARLLLILPLVCAAVWGWYGARWYLANVISEVVTTGDTPNVDLAQMATRWGPADPFTHWRLGVAAQSDFTAANIQETVHQFGFAVRLSPNDFRYWDEYGRALEASGDSGAAEKALRRSVDLAPNYYYPRWHLGNLLLREGKFEKHLQTFFARRPRMRSFGRRSSILPGRRMTRMSIGLPTMRANSRRCARCLAFIWWA